MWKSGSVKDTGRKLNKKWIFLVFIIPILAIFSYLAYIELNPTIEEVIQNQVSYSEGFTDAEKQIINSAISAQYTELDNDIFVALTITENVDSNEHKLESYVPVTNYNSAIQKVAKSDLSNLKLGMLNNTDQIEKQSIADNLELDTDSFENIDSLSDIDIDTVIFIPVDQLDSSMKLLAIDDFYYLDSFNSGAIFRTATFTSDGVDVLTDIKLQEEYSTDNVLKINQTGVTALTRVMQTKLNSVGDPLYFSENIGEFLSDADITHVSNEVSFKKGCEVSYTIFCSDPRFIETLKASGVDLVELTGNHNNDVGNQYNTETIELYKSLGWDVFGGGLNTEDAAKFYVAGQKQSKIAFLGYNYPDSPNGGAIAGPKTAGANSFDFTFESIKNDIDLAKEQTDFVIVDVQFWECYAYPDGYVEYPVCDLPIGEQEETFKKLIDLGADMVVGSSAHQPQIYELYNGKPIYYGLGNLYFDQTQWPGTERGIILTHYFAGGKLVQTKLTPTYFDKSLQTTKMDDLAAVEFLQRLQTAR